MIHATPCASSAVNSTPAHSSTRTLRRTVLSGAIGNALEWYDFALYGYFSTLLAQLFFPSNDPATSLLATYGAFAAGFVMRPLGGIIFGLMGDRLGRKQALVWAIHLMSLPTFLIGCLPTYATLGWIAPALLTLIRLLQGVSMGGGFTGSIVFIVEHAAQGKRGFWGSLAPLSALMGILLGAGLATLLSYTLSSDALSTWGWRLPFLLSLAGSWLASYMRRTLTDPSSFTKPAASHKPKAPFRTLWQHHKKALVTLFLVDFLVAVGFYMIVTFLVGYYEHFVGLARTDALLVHTCGMLAFALVILPTGWMLDLWGRKPLMVSAALGFALLTVPLFQGILTHGFYALLFAHVTFGALMGIYFAAIPAVLVESFPARVRYLGISLAHNLSMALFGGSTPFVLTFLVKTTHSLLAPAFCLVFASLAALGGLWMLNDGTKRPLD